MKIDLHKMLLLNRRDAVKEQMVTKQEKWGWNAWKKAMLSRKLTDFFGGRVKNFLLGFLFKKAWGNHRDLPKAADKSFAQQWQERNQGEI